VRTLVALLVKDFAAAKTRLELEPAAARVLAADLALTVMNALPRGAVVVAGSEEVAGVARALGLEAVLEERPAGQNPAAGVAVELARARSADALLLISSDLPLATAAVIQELLAFCEARRPPVAIAVPAAGRGGTNALYLAPPDAVDLHFGDDSLRKFEADARRRGVSFELFDSAALALDLDDPADLEALRSARP
jgi:2-phospho-L-lactate guanylyltransferase